MEEDCRRDVSAGSSGRGRRRLWALGALALAALAAAPVRAGGRIESVTAYGRFWNWDASNNYAPWPTNASLLTSVSRYANGPCAYAPAGTTCKFDTRALLTHDHHQIESITAYGRFWNFDSDAGYAPWSTNASLLTSVSRYAGGPCAYAPAGTTCKFDSRTFVPLANGHHAESITAYGRYWNFEVETGYAPWSSNASLLAGVARYAGPSGPCGYAPAGSPCTFDSRTFISLHGQTIESITAYGRYWNFDATNNSVPWPGNGSLLTSVSRYASGPCAYKPAGANCTFDTRLDPEVVDLLEFFCPACAGQQGARTGTRNKVGGECFYTYASTLRGKSGFYIVKSCNNSSVYEAFNYDDAYIYHLEDTSWATQQGGVWQDAKCSNGEHAYSTYLNGSYGAQNGTCGAFDQAASAEGGIWVPRRMVVGDSEPHDVTVVAKSHSTCACCQAQYTGPTGRTIKLVSKKEEDLPAGLGKREVVRLAVMKNSPGAGENFWYARDYGWIAFHVLPADQADADFSLFSASNLLWGTDNATPGAATCSVSPPPPPPPSPNPPPPSPPPPAADEGPLRLYGWSAPAGHWVTECIEGDAAHARVWQRGSTGSRLDWKYVEDYSVDNRGSCGSTAAGMYPLNFKGANVPAGTWVRQCTGAGHRQRVWLGNGTQYVPFYVAETCMTTSAGCPETCP